MRRLFPALLSFLFAASLLHAAPTKTHSTPQKSAATPKTTPAAQAAEPALPTAAGSAEVPEGPKVLKIFIAGDSTAADYAQAEQLRGWGMYLGQHFTSAVQVLNKARRGRTARLFLDDGIWKVGLKEKPDIVLIQFGHNEMLKASTDSDPVTQKHDIKKYLQGMIASARQAEATPILLTPTHHVIFDAAGQLMEDKMTTYVQTAREVAEARGVPLIDIYRATGLLFAKLGPKRAQELAATDSETVHFGPLGAWTIADIVARELQRLDPRLAAAAKPPGGPNDLVFAPKAVEPEVPATAPVAQ